MSTLNQYTALLMETHPYYQQARLSMFHHGQIRASAVVPRDWGPSAEHNMNLREHIQWITRMMEDTMPIAHALMRDFPVPGGPQVSQEDPGMVLVEAAMRLGTFVELANDAAEAVGVEETLELRYWPDTRQLYLRFVDVGVVVDVDVESNQQNETTSED